MDEQLIQTVTERIWAQMAQQPRALLLGNAPERELGYRYVDEPPYEAVVIGSLNLGELLCFRQEQALTALAQGMPVYLWTPGLPDAGRNRALLARVNASRRELRSWGIQFLEESPSRPYISAQKARQLAQQGQLPPAHAIVSPLAQEILEQKLGGISWK